MQEELLSSLIPILGLWFVWTVGFTLSRSANLLPLGLLSCGLWFPSTKEVGLEWHSISYFFLHCLSVSPCFLVVLSHLPWFLMRSSLSLEYSFSFVTLTLLIYGVTWKKLLMSFYPEKKLICWSLFCDSEYGSSWIIIHMTLRRICRLLSCGWLLYKYLLGVFNGVVQVLYWYFVKFFYPLLNVGYWNLKLLL
jgi:hypothetical protein